MKLKKDTTSQMPKKNEKAKNRGLPLGERVDTETKEVAKAFTGPKQMQYTPEVDKRKRAKELEQIKENKKRRRRSANNLK